MPWRLAAPRALPVAGLGAEQQAGAFATHLDVHPPEPRGHRAWGRGDDDEAVVTVGERRDLPDHRLPGGPVQQVGIVDEEDEVGAAPPEVDQRTGSRGCRHHAPRHALPLGGGGRQDRHGAAAGERGPSQGLSAPSCGPSRGAPPRRAAVRWCPGRSRTAGARRRRCPAAAHVGRWAAGKAGRARWTAARGWEVDEAAAGAGRTQPWPMLRPRLRRRPGQDARTAGAGGRRRARPGRVAGPWSGPRAGTPGRAAVERVDRRRAGTGRRPARPIAAAAASAHR